MTRPDAPYPIGTPVLWRGQPAVVTAIDIEDMGDRRGDLVYSVRLPDCRECWGYAEHVTALDEYEQKEAV